jgi:hypothetical protein
MDSWSFTVCLPELLVGCAFLAVMGFVCWILGEQTGWEAGFLDGVDLKDEREREAFDAEDHAEADEH